MRRLFRILLNAATVGSLVLCVATAALAIRSAWVADAVVWTAHFDGDALDHYAVITSRGGVRFTASHYRGLTYTTDTADGRLRYRRAPASRDPLYDRSRLQGTRAWGPAAGFEVVVDAWAFTADSPPRGWRQRALTFPLCVPALLFAAAPVWYGRRRLRAARVRTRGLCPACGYDLCATPERCPECGLVPGRPAANPL
jgi:hypothetical protein